VPAQTPALVAGIKAADLATTYRYSDTTAVEDYSNELVVDEA
jgi:hypothetical protein